jgi:hypothetical protein
MGALDESSEILIPKKLTLPSSLGSPENGFSRVLASEAQDSLHQAESSNSTLLVGGIGPSAKRRTHSLASTEKFCDIGFLAPSDRRLSGSGAN